MDLCGPLRYIIAKGIDPKCTTCGHERMALSDTVGDTVWAVSARHPPFEQRKNEPSIPVAVLMCGKCFTIRQHGLLAILEWLLNNPESGNDSH